MELTERDITIFRMVHKWRFLLSRHIKELGGFTSEAICFRRLRKLVEGGFLARKRILYGVPAVYTITSRARRLIEAPHYSPKIRIEQLRHDALALDLMVAYARKARVAFADVLSPRDINAGSGFGGSAHVPDFVIGEVAFELELTLKTKERLFRNIKANFGNYEAQVWLIHKSNRKLKGYLEEAGRIYPLEIVYLEDLTA